MLSADPVTKATMTDLAALVLQWRQESAALRQAVQEDSALTTGCFKLGQQVAFDVAAEQLEDALRRRRGVQLTLARGTTQRRVLWWPQHGHVGLRLYRDWWASVHWQR
jgi:hypothetical protein